jgi:hypothetical protein
MGKNYNSSRLVNGLSVDASNNIGIGGSPSGSYKFEVTGTGRFTSDLSITGGSYFLQRASGSAILPVLRYWNGTGNPMNGGALGDILTIGTQGTNDFTIATDNVRRLTILSNGNVGIGTTSPFNFGAGHRTLDVRGDGITSIGAIFAGNSDRTAVIGFYINPSATGTIGTSSNHALQLVTNDAERIRITPTGNVCIGTSTSSGFGNINLDLNAAALPAAYFVIRTGSNTVTAEYAVDSGVAYLSTKTAHPLVLRTSDVERMRITSGGQVQIKQAGNTYNDGLGLINTAGNIFSLVLGGNNNIFLGFNYGDVGYFNYSTGAYIPISDINKKKDFEDSTIGLNAILGLKPTLYRMKDDEELADKHLGLIAQEVKEFIPQAYVESINGENTFIGLDYQAITSALVKAIQELKGEVDSLKAQINN